jgi:selenocysteine-specific elongation factor
MKSVIIGTAGHIDHGKSALVRALTGIDPDRLKEEQERGITIDLGFAHWQAAEITFAFVDVPGHERFVKNMLAGAGGFDAVLLVVAADESVMPQTREHFEICRLLRIPAGLIVLTKCDLVDADTRELVGLEVHELVAGSFLERAPVIAASSRTGEGLDELRAALVALAGRAAARPAEGPVRLPIDRVFTMKGFGTVVTGTLVAGRVAQDEDLDVLPPVGRDLHVGTVRRVKVRGIQVHGARHEAAMAGQRAALNLGGVETSDLSRGDTLVTPGSLEATRVLDAVVEAVAGAKPLRHGARVRFHQGTSEVLGRVAIAVVGGAGVGADGGAGAGGRARAEGAGAEAGSGVVGPGPLGGVPSAAAALGCRDPGHPLSEIPPGGRACIRLRLESPAVVTRGDRYILRAYSPPVTIAGGEVLDPHPPRGGIRTAAARRRFAELDPMGAPDSSSSTERALVVMIEEAGAAGFPARDVVSRAGLAPAAGQDAIGRLLQSGRVARAGEYLVAAGLVATLARDLLQTLGDYHRAQPLSEGMPREEVRERLFGRAAAAVFEYVVAQMVAGGKIVARDRLALAGYTLSLSPDEERVRTAIEYTYREAGLRPPDQATLAPTFGAGPDLVDRIVKLLLRQKVLVKVDSLLFHEDALRRLRDEVIALKHAPAPARLDVGTFKDRYGITRKYAIPLLEYLDRERITRRVGDARVVM